MFERSEIQKPNYTVRLLLSHIYSETGEDIRLKPYSHFTLACTLRDEPSIDHLFGLLADYLDGPLTLAAEEVVNLGTYEKPLWAVRLNLGENEAAFRDELSQLFDDIICHEMNGVRYLWNPTGNQEIKCPHVTIGSSVEDGQKAQKLVDGHYEFTFDRIDYKQVGNHDPYPTKELTEKAEATMGMRR
jgi:hypothetical protein